MSQKREENGSTLEEVLEKLKYFAAMANLEAVKTYFSPNRRNGLYEGSILSNPLWVPYPDGIINQHQTGSGYWVAYDFKRATKRKEGFFTEGRIMSFLPDEIANNKPNEKTPDNFFRFWDFEHFKTADYRQVAELEREGLLVETTYEEALRKVGWLEYLRKDLMQKQREETKVFQVTPKGNGLLYLRRIIESDRREEEERMPELAPAYIPVRY